jgi:hypothetical protein
LTRDDDDESPPITFVRGANLERLAIEALVDLANPKLIMRFQDSLAASAPSAKGDTTKGNIIKVVGGGCSVGVEWRS